MKVFSLILTATLLTVISTATFAQNAIGENPCAPDVQKLCKGMKKRDIVLCLNKNVKELSPQCIAQMNKVKAKIKEKMALVAKNCKTELEKVCAKKNEKETRKPNEIMKCLKENETKLTPACKAQLKK